MKLIVGLGNPWEKYMKTRHNIGFVALDYFLGVRSEEHSEESKRIFSYNNKIWGEVAKSPLTPFSKGGESSNEKVYFLKPMEFMNRSGGAVQRLAHFYKIAPKDILVLHDEIDLPVGVVKYKFGWGLAGHNGLKDIANKLWTQDFARIRIGVDRPADKNHVADYVLSSFKPVEREKIMDQFSVVEKLIREFVGV